MYKILKIKIRSYFLAKFRRLSISKMSSSDSEDSYQFGYYSVSQYENQAGPPLIKKKSRLIAAVVQNQVEILRNLLDSPRWYKVRDANGYSLLQIAIFRDNVEVFDYLLSIPNFPLEFKNKKGQTALIFALGSHEFRGIYVWMREHFAYELIKKGACIDEESFQGQNALHAALLNSYFRTAKLIIQRGADMTI
ncbi:poly [ADP-ribose] polymerase tankyrase-like isoform X2 [Zophobas morio]|uniref:poly [ADP-ribose] polymerase tankyrase-like isoform X2 n=1 Tax=Zophobas morio TaxID=2755281 RepID=UPI003082A3DF